MTTPQSPATSPDLRNTSEIPATDQTLSQTDMGLVRVLEDLIDVLMQKGVLQFTDLPAAAQTKLLERQSARAALKDPLTLLGPDDENWDLTESSSAAKVEARPGVEPG